MYVNLKNPNTNEIKHVKMGYSWTTLFWGFFPALFRGDWKWALIMFLLAWFTFGGINIIFSFFYNKIYIRDLINKGFEPADEVSRTNLMTKGIAAF